jgi:hypothetical protein
MSFLIIGCITLYISIIVSFMYYRKLQPQWLRSFAWFLLFILIIQFVAYSYSHYTKKSNVFIINSITAVEFLFYFFVFFKAFDKKKLKQLTLIFALIFILFFLYHIYLGSGIFINDTASYSAGSFFIIICCLVYFYSLFQSELNLNYFRIPMFWISTGLLFFFIGSSIYDSLFNYIINHNLDPRGIFFKAIMITLNLLLYGLFTCGLLSNQIWKTET